MVDWARTVAAGYSAIAFAAIFFGPPYPTGSSQFVAQLVGTLIGVYIQYRIIWWAGRKLAGLFRNAGDGANAQASAD